MSFSQDPTADQKESYTLPNGEEIKVEELVLWYKQEQIVPVPSVVIYDIGNDDKISLIQIQWSQILFKNDDSENGIYSVAGHLTYEGSTISSIRWSFSNKNDIPYFTSERGDWHFWVQKDEKIGNQVLKIFSTQRLAPFSSIDVDKMKHGPIVWSPEFGCVAFSPNETRILYVAEKRIKSESYFSTAMESESKGEIRKGSQYEWKEDWGEQLDSLCHTCVCVLTIGEEWKHRIIEMPNRTLAKPFWIDNRTIGFVAYPESPKRLRMFSCQNRVSYLYTCELAESDEGENILKMIRGHGNDLHLMNPQINSQRDKVVFFESPACGPHSNAQRLMLWDLKRNKISTVFDDYEEKHPIKSLFVPEVASNYWLSDGEHILLSTIHHSKMVLFTLNVLTKALKMIDLPGCFGEVTILNLRNDLLSLSCSSPIQPPLFLIGFIDMKCNRPVKFESADTVLSAMDDKIRFEIIKQNEDKPLEQIETILIGLASTFTEPTPVIVIPHGGPHAASLASYDKTHHLFVRLGFKVALINYRGSLGISKQYVSQLAGHVGDLDVKDCISAIKNLIELQLIDKKNISLYGASYGGFLVCHLIGQYPEFNFASCTALNPVTDLVKMFNTTDIPDWALIETLGCDVETYKKLNNLPEEDNLVEHLNRIILGPTNSEILQAMSAKSPVMHVESVKTPVLMILGKNDKRVPSCLGQSFVKALEKRNVETQCYMYPDNHLIGKPMHDGDLTINTARWILSHMN